MKLAEKLLSAYSGSAKIKSAGSFKLDEDGNMSEGLTAYWTFKKNVHGPSYKKAIADIAKMVSKSKLLGNAYGDDGSKPEVKSGIAFNGKGEDSYETFSLPKATPKAGFNFCKTAGKPYDKYVNASLLILQSHLGDSIEVSTDGNLNNGKSLAKKFSSAEGAPIALIKKKTKRELAIEKLDELGEPNFNDSTVKISINRHDMSGGKGFQLRANLFITKERQDAMKAAGVNHTVMARSLEDYMYKRFGTLTYGTTEFYKDGRAKGDLVPYVYSIKSFGDARTAYGIGANLDGYGGGNSVSTTPAQVKKKMEMFDDMLHQLDSFKANANAEIDTLTSDKEERSKIWQAKYMPTFIKMSDKFKAKGFINPKIIGM